MNPSDITIALLSFALSFLFALGGVGAAVVLIPALVWTGIPFHQARSAGLFVNTVSMLGATWSNIRAKRVSFRLGLPVILSSAACSPLGAWAGHLVDTRIVMLALIAFLLFSGTMMCFFHNSKSTDGFREDTPVTAPLLTGAASGFLSGLLGVGGGALISPLMILQGFNPKKVATVTALAVPFSSFSAFLTYAAMGSVSLKILAIAGLAALAGGYLGTMVMHARIPPSAIRKFLGTLLLLVAVKLTLSHL